jgi:hypothetical protein
MVLNSSLMVADGPQRFVPLREPPSDVEVARLLARVRGRILRLLRRHDIDLEGSSGDGRGDPLALESPVLAQVQGASVIGRVATGPRAGQRVLRVGSDPTTPPVTTGGPRQHQRCEVPSRRRWVKSKTFRQLLQLIRTIGIRAGRPGAVRPLARRDHPPIRRAPGLGALRRTSAARGHGALQDILRHLTRSLSTPAPLRARALNRRPG